LERVAEQKMTKWADPEALGFIALGIAIFASVPFLCGWVESISAVASVPWVVAAFITLIIVAIINFRNGNLMGGTAIGVLGIVLSGAVALKAVQDLVMLITNTTEPPALIAGGAVVEGMAWLAMGIVLIPIGFLGGYTSRFLAIFVWLANVSIFMVAAADFGVISHATADASAHLVLALGAWFLYMGIAMLVNGVLERAVLPLGKPLFKRKASAKA